MTNHPEPSAPKLSPIAMPKTYLLIADSPIDGTLLAAFANLPVKEKEIWIEKLGEMVFLAQFGFPPEDTLHWIKTKAGIAGKVGVIEMPHMISI